jgi:hypothetical protein
VFCLSRLKQPWHLLLPSVEPGPKTSSTLFRRCSAVYRFVDTHFHRTTSDVGDVQIVVEYDAGVTLIPLSSATVDDDIDDDMTT